MKQATCPRREDLLDYVGCRIDEELATSIAKHLDECPKCEATVVSFERNEDTVADRIRRAVATPTFSTEPECKQIMQALCESLEATQSKVGTPADAKPEASLVGEVRDYRILEKLGQGGMGAVYKAVHKRLKRTVALKVLATTDGKNPVAVGRFEREMAVLGQLTHPNIVQALDAGEHEGQLYLVMEHVEGADLSDVLRRCHPLSVADACEMVRQAALGLQYAFEHGFVHRDIKPSNLMLAVGAAGADANQVKVKILDLGLARASSGESNPSPETSELTEAGNVVGTLDFMAPEQGGDSHKVDIRADIYSLGATLYKLLTGHSPFSEYSQYPPLQRLMAIAQNDPPGIQTKRADVPTDLAAVVGRMLAKQPDKRFATPRDVASSLAPFCKGANLASLLVPMGPTQTFELPAPDVAPTTATQSAMVVVAADPTPNRPRRPLAGWVAGAVVALAMMAGVFITTRYGVVEITSPDGKLPDDLKVVLSKDGQEIELLQADNHWSAKLVKGEYQIQIRNGDDRFEVKDAKLTVTRMGRTLVTVQKKLVGGDLPAAAAKTPAPADPLPVAVVPAKPQFPVDAEKPFALVRDGKWVRAFKSLAGAIGEMNDNDSIYITSNARLTVKLTDPVTKRLHLSGASGFRPMLYFPGVHSLQLRNDCLFEDCDFDFRDGSIHWGSEKQAHTYRRCRVWGSPGICRSLRASDCVFVLFDGFTTQNNNEGDFQLENCAIRVCHHLLSLDGGAHTLVLKNCTINSEAWPATSLAKLEPTARLSVSATGNHFHHHSQSPSLIDPKYVAQVDWKGSGNFYSGRWHEEYDVVNGEWKLKAKGLAGWNRLWKQSEQDSREAETVALEWGRIQNLTGAERTRAIQAEIEKLKSRQGLTDVGPDWSLIGAGAAYVRACKAEGKKVPNSQLRPERLEGGPFTLIRQDKEIQGYPKLEAALAEAKDQDTVEIRSDGLFDSVVWTGAARTLTIRAGLGYTPVFKSVFGPSGTDRVILEGLVCEEGFRVGGTGPELRDSKTPLLPTNGAFLRLKNCSVVNSPWVGTFGWFERNGNSPAEIVNCDLPTVFAGLRAKERLIVRNSVFRELAPNTDRAAAEAGSITLDRCAFWGPYELAGGSWNKSLFVQTAMDHFHAEKSIFVSPSYVLLYSPESEKWSKKGFKWSGAGNVYCNPFQLTSHLVNLQALQSHFKTDADSIELHPWEFDPAQWRIIRKQSPGYQPRSDGKDYGVDVDRLLAAITPPVVVGAPATPAEKPAPVAQKTRVLPPVAPAPAVLIPDAAKPFVVLKPDGVLSGEFRFAAEALAVLKNDEILEVRGNGPFRLPQITLSNRSLHLRAGKGYRPRFVPGFESKDGVVTHWFHLENVPLIVEGCDFVGASRSGFNLFVGSGTPWRFVSCRLIQRSSFLGSVVSYSGEKLTICDSLITNLGQQAHTIGVNKSAEVEFENNVVSIVPVLFHVSPMKQHLALRSNKVYFAAYLMVPAFEGSDQPTVSIDATENLFGLSGALVLNEKPILPRRTLTWNGNGNIVSQFQKGAIWSNKLDASEDLFLRTMDAWNKYWGNPNDITVVPQVDYDWDFFARADWRESVRRVDEELSATRKRFPKLGQLGPDLKKVGAGDAYDLSRGVNLEKRIEQRPEALEGGPFVLLRGDKVVNAFFTLNKAIENTQASDVIEVRSDAVFENVAADAPADRPLTLRSAAGYRPIFKSLALNNGDWTLEGLQVQQAAPGRHALSCMARRLVHCAVQRTEERQSFYLLAPAKWKQPIEILRCYLPDGIRMIATSAVLENSVLGFAKLEAEGDSSFTVSRSYFLGFPNSQIGHGPRLEKSGPGKLAVQVADTVFDTNYVLATSDNRITWSGERNLYRVHSSNWASFPPPDGKNHTLLRNLDEWQAHWKSDADSQEEDAIILRPELFRRLDRLDTK